MDLKERISALAYWGETIMEMEAEQMEYLFRKASAHNSWFTENSIRLSLEGLERYLDKPKLEQWVSKYAIRDGIPKTVGLVMAGNIPLAGFHDFLTVLVTGNKVQAKLSSQDPFLLPYLSKILTKIEPRFDERIAFVERLKGFDEIIATGSDNSARYFNYYFSKYPHVIRQNRTSCAIIRGNETESDLEALGKDVFEYFGLGCRNVSKIYIPAGYDVGNLFKPFEVYKDVINHHKFSNNYDYQKSIMLVNSEQHLDFGFLLLKETEKLVSPISVLFYEYYNSDEELQLKIASVKNKIQCIVAADNTIPDVIPPGKAQKPELWDFADKVDTVRFLLDE